MFLSRAQILVEYHADIADQHAPLGRDADPFRRDFEQPLALVLAQFIEFGGKVIVEIDKVGDIERLFRDFQGIIQYRLPD